jgi:CHAD domain-containing protein
MASSTGHLFIGRDVVAEIEAKFLVHGPMQLDRLLELLQRAGYAAEPRRNETIVDRYYDTTERHILRAGWAYRQRNRDGEHTLGLKSLTPPQGDLHVREEIEQAALAPGVELDTLPSGPVREQLAAMVNGRAPEELFAISNNRTVYDLVACDDDGMRVELCIDQAEIVAPNAPKSAPRVLRFTEVELELKEGTRASLEKLARVVAADSNLLPARLSKFERGLQAAGLPAPAWTGARAPRPARSDPLVRLAHFQLRRQLDVLELQQPRAWEGLDSGGVHAMRIATRRIRAAVRAFRDVLPRRTAATLEADFRWLAGALAEVRDLDVYRDNLGRYMQALPPDDAQHLVSYDAWLTQQAAKARRRLVTALGSRRYARVIGRLQRFLDRGPSRAALRSGPRIEDAAHVYLERRLRKVLKRGRSMGSNAAAEALHALRIRAKRLRYELEFLSDLYSGRLEPMIDATRRLQDFLGEQQDALAASERLRHFARTAPVRSGGRRLLLALGELVQVQEGRAAAQREQFPREWRRFEKSVSRKRLRQALAAE